MIFSYYCKVTDFPHRDFVHQKQSTINEQRVLKTTGHRLVVDDVRATSTSHTKSVKSFRLIYYCTY